MTTDQPDDRPDSGLGSSGMGSGDDAGTPGDRQLSETDDAVAAAVQDDAPLPPDLAPGGGAQDEPPDELTPEFREP